MALEEVLSSGQAAGSLLLHAVDGMPNTEDMELTQELREFYSLCGGCVIWPGKDYEISLVAPSGFVRANPIIVGEDCRDDRSWNWWIIGEKGEQRITVDLDPTRLGRMYDSFWDRHGLVGDCPIVSCSLEDFLLKQLGTEGSNWFWLDDGFTAVGDAYDD